MNKKMKGALWNINKFVVNLDLQSGSVYKGYKQPQVFLHMAIQD